MRIRIAEFIDQLEMKEHFLKQFRALNKSNHFCFTWHKEKNTSSEVKIKIVFASKMK